MPPAPPTPTEVREEVGNFIDKLYGGETGVVYAPIYYRKADKWERVYYDWPNERSEIIEHVVTYTVKAECYIAPALFNSKGNSKKENIKGSNVVWVELDGKAFTSNDEAPNPSFWIQSSSEDHWHVYWLLDKFCPDIPKIEDINKALTGEKGADASGWDANQVLRFPFTYNHKRQVFTGELQVNNVATPLSVMAFDNLERPKVSINAETFDFSKVPGNITEMAFQKILGESGTELFFKQTVEINDRSAALMRLAYTMAEQKYPWTDYEMFAALLAADDKWGKFKGRQDRNKRLIGIIEKARQKYPNKISVLVDKDLEPINLTNLLEETKPVEYAINGLLIEFGAYMLVGDPGTGKTQLTMQMAMSMACGRKYLKYDFTEPGRAMFMSLEMGRSELLSFAEKMAKSFTKEERHLIDENLIIHPIGEPIYMNDPKGQAVADELIANCQPDGVFIDSYSMALMGDLSSDVAVNEFNAWIKSQRMKHKCFFWFVHHLRKKQPGGGKITSMADIFGSTYIAAGITNAGLLHSKGSTTEFSVLKDRHAKKEYPYNIIRDSDTLMFGIDGVAGILKTAEAVDSEEPNDDTDKPNLSSTI